MDELLGTSWHSYPSIYALGHRAVADIFSDEVYIEEKVDGSQFSFGIFDGTLKFRSRRKEMTAEMPEKMFTPGVEAVKSISHLLHEGWTYRGEYFSKPQHNTLKYDRIPNGHTVIFDVNTGHEEYLGWEAKKEEANRLGFECIPYVFKGVLESASSVKDLIERESFLGGAKVEGVVVKAYGMFGPDKKVLMGKYVSEAFKEVHQGTWKANNPGATGIIEQLVASYKTDARFVKAVQRLRDEGELTNEPKDIPKIFKEVNVDIEKECIEDIKDALWAWARVKFMKGVTNDIPTWYKNRLLEKQFES